MYCETINLLLKKNTKKHTHTHTHTHTLTLVDVASGPRLLYSW